MKLLKKLLFVVQIILLLLVTGNMCLAASLEKAIEAYEFEEYDNAIKWLKPWAADGEAEAQYRLGLIYENGYGGVDIKTRNALKWYRLAAEQGHRSAKRRLESLRKSASNAGGTESVATQWYQDLAEEGDSEAQYNLGYMHEIGWSVPKDDSEAAHWYEKSALKGVTKAQFRLGMMYLVGAGVKQSEIQGEKWLRLAVKNDHALAGTIQDEILEAEDKIKINIDIVKVINKVRITSQKNEQDAESIVIAAVAKAKEKISKETAKKKQRLEKIQSIQSASGQKIISDDALLGVGGTKTLKWYKVRAERGIPEAQYELGQLYEKGDGVRKDFKQAVQWYGLAAEQGHLDAQYYLGMWYANGISVTQDEGMASRYLASASSKGHSKANKYVEKTGANKLVNNEESIAVWWLQQQALRGSASARFNLGYLYESGRGVNKDMVLAEKLYQFAGKQGYKPAQDRLQLIRSGRATTLASAQRVKSGTQKAEKSKGANTTINSKKSQAGEKNTKAEAGSTESSLVWYGLVSLMIIAPIIGFMMVIKRERKVV